MFEYIKRKFERKSSATQDEYLHYLNRNGYLSLTRSDQEGIVEKVYLNRYEVYAHTQPVRTAIDFIARGVQDIEILLYQIRSNGQNELIADKKSVLKDCDFDHPSPTYNPTMDSLLNKIVIEYFLNGSYCIMYNKNTGSFFVIPSNKYTRQAISQQQMINNVITFNQVTYEYDYDSGSFANSGKTQLIFLFDKDPWTLKNSDKSTLSEIATEISLYNSANLYSLDMYQNAGANTILSAKDVHNQDNNWKEKLENFKSQLNDAKYNNKTVATLFDVGVQRLRSPLSDMEYLKTLSTAKDAIFQAFGVHPALFTGEASTMDNFKQARQSLWHNVIIPLSVEIMQNLQTVLFTANEVSNREYYLDIDRSKIQIIKEEETDNAIKLRNAGIISLNEARSDMGKHNVVGGEIILSPANMVQIATDEDGATKTL